MCTNGKISMKISLSIGLVVAVLCTGCGTRLDFIRLNPPPKQLVQRPASEVEVFMTAKPTRDYVEIGMIESQQRAWQTDGPEVIFEKMRQEAGLQGCEGLIVNGSNDGMVVSGSGNFISGSTLKGYRATCIVYP
jgi:hypothetical protein